MLTRVLLISQPCLAHPDFIRQLLSAWQCQGVMEANPFIGMMQNKTEKNVRTISRSQILRFYLWSLHQPPRFRNLECAAMFMYLTGFRAAEVRPFHINEISKNGIRVANAKRKKRQQEIVLPQ